jgi:hypothetical protein
VDEGMHYYASMTAVYNVHDLCKFGISLAWSTFLAVFGNLQEAENMIKGMTSKSYVKGFTEGLQNPHCDVKMGKYFTK